MGQPVKEGEWGGEGERRGAGEQYSKQKGCREENTVMSVHVIPGRSDRGGWQVAKGRLGPGGLGH